MNYFKPIPDKFLAFSMKSTIHTHFLQGEFTIKDGDSIVEATVNNFNLSIMASDSITGIKEKVVLASKL